MFQIDENVLLFLNGHLGNNDSNAFISKLNVNRKALFIFLRANKYTLNEYVLNAVLCPNAITKEDVEHWIQYSIDNEMPLGSVVVDMWYRQY